MDEFIGILKLFAGNYAPQGWALCNGQLLPIVQNQALFSIIGNTYGGDGRTNFALPDLRGRVALGMGQGPGLSNQTIGQTGGQETTTITVSNLPAHNHPLAAGSADGTSSDPTNNYPAKPGVQVERGGQTLEVKAYGSSPNGAMGAQAIGQTGGNQPFNNMQPFMAMNYIICLQGIYPSRS